MNTEGSILTFYSYKGGVGRTLALANIAALLSQWGFKTLCVDWDLEAPGLHLYFNKWIVQDNQQGLLDLIRDRVAEREPNWRNYLSTVRFPYHQNELAFLKAGKQDKSYIDEIQSIAWAEYYEIHNIGSYFEQLRNEWKNEYDFILIDSRTGITDIGGICSVQFPDFLIILLTPNDQGIIGSLDVVSRIVDARSSLPFDRGKLLIMPIISRLEFRSEYKLAQEWLGKFIASFEGIFSEWLHKRVSAHDITNLLRIPYISYWSFGEKLPVVEKGTDDPEDLGFYYETIASLIAYKFSKTDALVRGRESFVRSAKSISEVSSPDSIFISYSMNDEKFAKRLYRDLENNGIRCWMAGEDLKVGEPIREAIDAQIRSRDKVIVIMSKASVQSEWVADEVEAAIEEEQIKGNIILLPIRLDEAVLDTREDWAAKIKRRRHIGDFSGWQDENTYNRAFERLVRDIKASKIEY